MRFVFVLVRSAVRSTALGVGGGHVFYLLVHHLTISVGKNDFPTACRV